VMARRDIVRKIKWGEFDQRALLSTLEVPEKLTDDNDWKMVWTDDTRFLTSRMKDRAAAQSGNNVGAGDQAQSEKVGLYVRIMNDAEMLNARRRWVSRNTAEEKAK